MKKIIYILLVASSSVLMADFSRTTQGVVTDNVTTLEWQDDYSANAGAVKQAAWEDAIAYCEALTLDGTGWRLPNIVELKSIIDYSKASPSMDTVFTNVASYYYWSSTTYAGYSGNAWYVYFNYGRQYNYNKTNSSYVRCVRAGQ